MREEFKKDSIVLKRGLLNLDEGARKFARRLARERGKQLLDAFVYVAYARKGWMVPNQYWTPGALSPMAIWSGSTASTRTSRRRP